MLQQTQVKTVIPYWERWMRALPTIASLASAKPERVLKLWEGLGYYRRARHLHAAAKVLVERHDGQMPVDFTAVLALPGVGRYTAGAICSIAFNQAVPILDGNAIRVLARVFGVRESTRERQTLEKLWALAEALVRRANGRPKTGLRQCAEFNQALMELGALMCLPRQPKCVSCPLRGVCLARREESVDALPNQERRPALTHRHFVAFVIERKGCYLVRQRPADAVNAELWEFPNTEVTGESRDKLLLARELLNCVGTAWTPLCEIKHSITRYRVTCEAVRLEEAATTALQGVWRTPRQLRRLTLTSAHRKILARLKARPKTAGSKG